MERYFAQPRPICLCNSAKEIEAQFMSKNK